ncbi:peptidoglycan/LPS O-acetylase OafA/YrhL [Rhizomicrobium palustre]|uniref:Peptidoglycan/LPS O-acetylase OafA/YrhL n=1 Tax=Rhizomicrobium palustre TaxID=189966 RepID=A0A846MYD3_9PROT|nr:acyltransferase [Rhizomicrobium palustre]NIK88628.1 peptidoglycan/LPS O-acetylase OafA/YrhL [Rhizomicrobium palustre]
MKRLYSLDAIRGLAALTIVIWHWQHFFALSGHWQTVWSRDWQPLYRVLEPLYLEAWAAVDLFFALSGFVFFWLYGQAIREGKVKPGHFALLRFSRLWPLHALMLVTITVLQALFHAKTGVDFIFPAEGWDRFAAHALMLHQWLPPTIEQTFNGPSWTVSIEAGLYVLFFLLCRAGFNGWRVAVLVALCGVFLFSWNWFIARGLMGFFLGGAAYYAVEKIRLMKAAKTISAAICLFTLALWALVVVEIEWGPLHNLIIYVTDRLPDDAYDNEFTDRYFHIAYILTVIPISVVALALSEVVLGLFPTFYRKATHLGDISYGVYMLHFPLQTACALVAVTVGLQPSFFMQGWVMLAFYAVLLSLAWLSYTYFEKPMQKLIRKLVEKPESPKTAH